MHSLQGQDAGFQSFIAFRNFPRLSNSKYLRLSVPLKNESTQGI